MRGVLAALAALICLAAPAARAEGMADTFGNTVTVTYPDGEVLRFYFEPDGTFTMVGASGEAFTAQWTLKDQQICFVSSEGDVSCEPFPDGKKLGDTWSYVSAEGNTVTIAVTAGRP